MVELSEDIPCRCCGYDLRGLSPAGQCPECGTAFDAAHLREVAARAGLLPWERPEVGGRFKRFGRTVLRASFRPGRFFAAVGERKDRRFARAGLFVTACVIASLCLHVGAFFLEHLVFFLRFLWRQGASERALEATIAVARMNVSSCWYMPALQVLSLLLSIVVVGVLLACVFRRRSGAFRGTDFAAALSPAIFLGALIAASAQVNFASLPPGLVGTLVSVALWGQVVVLALFVWHCCRRLLVLGRAKSVAAVVVCGLLQEGVDRFVGFVLSQLMLLILV